MIPSLRQSRAVVGGARSETDSVPGVRYHRRKSHSLRRSASIRSTYPGIPSTLSGIQHGGVGSRAPVAAVHGTPSRLCKCSLCQTLLKCLVAPLRPYRRARPDCFSGGMHLARTPRLADPPIYPPVRLAWSLLSVPHKPCVRGCNPGRSCIGRNVASSLPGATRPSVHTQFRADKVEGNAEESRSLPLNFAPTGRNSDC